MAGVGGAAAKKLLQVNLFLANIGKPMVEAISGSKVKVDADFFRKRIACVVNVLHWGMLQ
jgi:hypothetical protein